MAKQKKNISQKLELHKNDYSDIPKDDAIERIMYCIGDKLSIDRVRKIIGMKNSILQNQTYSYIKITFYMEPYGSERPRVRSMGEYNRIYVPNSDGGRKMINKFLKNVKNKINIIHTPIYCKMITYHDMPKTCSIEEQVLFEAGIMRPVTKPDEDNILKFYQDICLNTIILDDDLIYSAKIDKFYSFLPRVELYFYYDDKFTSKYIYNKIKSRKTFKRIQDYTKLSLLM